MLDITLNYSIFTYLYFLWFYTDDDAGDGNKINNIGIHKKSATCYKCGSPFPKVKEVSLPKNMSEKFNTNKTEIDAVAAA